MVRGQGLRLGVGVFPVVLLVGVALSGCSTESDAAASDETPRAVVKAAPKGGTVGEDKSGCVLPVTFDIAPKWKPKAVGGDSGLKATRQADVTLACEIDAKAAGSIGSLRVWTSKDVDDPRDALEAFVEKTAESPDDVSYTSLKAGPYDAEEADYLTTNEYLDEPKQERALALRTPKGVVVVLQLNGLDSKEYTKMLPAYELARLSTLGR